MDGKDQPVFLCDSMLGGLARWLRAAGYVARFDIHADDGDLVRRCYEEGAWLLTSDSGILERYAVAEGLARCLFVPLGMKPVEQLGHVLRELKLPLLEPRCMLCGGELADVALDDVVEHVPRKVQAACSRYFRCAGCAKVYWRGTHWESIRRRLQDASEGA